MLRAAAEAVAHVQPDIARSTFVRDMTPQYGAFYSSWRWVAAVRERVDPDLGAIPHAAGFMDGWPNDGPRGESLALLSLILVDVDASLARQQYEVLRARFIDYVWGVPGVREYPHGVEGRGDVDSGPIVLEFSGPAVVVGAGAAIAHGDEDVAVALLATAEIFGVPIEIDGRRRFAGGRVPVGDAFLAWARTVPASRGSHLPRYDRVIPRLWRLPLQALSLLIAVVLVRLTVRAASAVRASLQLFRTQRRPAKS